MPFCLSPASRSRVPASAAPIVDVITGGPTNIKVGTPFTFTHDFTDNVAPNGYAAGSDTITSAGLVIVLTDERGNETYTISFGTAPQVYDFTANITRQHEFHFYGSGPVPCRPQCVRKAPRDRFRDILHRERLCSASVQVRLVDADRECNFATAPSTNECGSRARHARAARSRPRWHRRSPSRPVRKASQPFGVGARMSFSAAHPHASRAFSYCTGQQQLIAEVT